MLEHMQLYIRTEVEVVYLQAFDWASPIPTSKQHWGFCPAVNVLEETAHQIVGIQRP